MSLVNDVSVRAARPSDAPAIGAIQSTCWRETYADVLSPEEPFPTPAEFGRAWRAAVEEAPTPAHVVLVACEGPRVVGFVAVAPSEDPDADTGWRELVEGGVLPEVRRQGHGSRLLNAAADTVRDAGAAVLTVWVRAGGAAVTGLLSAAGFSPDGAFRERETDVSGGTLRETRLLATLSG